MNNSGKPEFTDGCGGIINPYRLSEAELNRLKSHLPKSMSIQEQKIFLRNTSEATDNWEMDAPENPMPVKEICNRIKDMELAAKNLQRAIRALQGEPYDRMQQQFDYLIFGSNPPARLPEQLRQQKIKLSTILDNVWDELQALKDTAKYTAVRLNISRTTKPNVQKAKFLVWWVATQYQQQFGKYPKSGKSDWFPAYMSTLGEILNLEESFGFTMISTAIKEMKKSNPAN